MKSFRFVLPLLAALLLAACADSPSRVSRYDVIWDSPSADASGSMPLGNGELGINLWVEAEGDLLFYLARTDTWSETGRPLKLGRVRVALEPNPFAGGAPFSQRLNLQEGCIEIEAGEAGQTVSLSVFANPDPTRSALYIRGKADQPLSITATTEIWRTTPYNVPERETRLNYATEWPEGGEFDPALVIESTDRTATDPEAVVWFHRNEHSLYETTVRHHELESLLATEKDPLLGRTFGGYISGTGFASTSETTLATTAPRKEFTLQVTTHSAITPDAESWVAEVAGIADEVSDANLAWNANRKRWAEFWDRSWIEVTTPGDDAGFRISQSYALQSWITAGSGLGNFPIKFNGSIFTVDSYFTEPDKVDDPDFRYWGGQYWWQNTRLPYHPMLAAGHFEMMQPMFRFYQNLLPTFRTIAGEFWGADGAVIPETASIFGLYRNGDYGWFRQKAGLKKGEIRNMYIRHEWNGSLELVSLMLDYFDYTGDRTFVIEQLLPLANDVLRYFDSRFPRNEQGVLQITPTQSLETYWYGVVNDMPCVAGLHNVLPRLGALPEELTDPAQRALWERLTAALPPIPVGEIDGQRRFLPAAEYENRTSNSEVPDLYTIFPFDLTHLGTDDRQVGINTYHARRFRGPEGWRQDGQMAAMLGLTDEARANILEKIANSNKNFRFPAIWGPNYDWTPDQDHGGNLMTTLQRMVLQSYGSRVYLLPAFPREWEVDFKLRVRGGATVSGLYRDGRWVKAPTTVGGEPVELIDSLN